MMAFGDKDLAFVLADVFSVAVVFSGQSTRGIMDEMDHDTDAGGRQTQIRKTVIRIVTGSLTGLAVESELRVDGVDRVVRDIALEDDGKITAILLADA